MFAYTRFVWLQLCFVLITSGAAARGDESPVMPIHVVAATVPAAAAMQLVAEGDVPTRKISTGLIGVLNNAHWVYETAQRRVSVDGKETAIPALSGKRFEQKGVRDLDVDSTLRITSRKPLSIAYRGARKVERGRATDELILNYLDGKREWKAGQVISEYEVRIVAGE